MNPSSESEMTLDEYKAMVRKEALRVQSEQGWCQDGLNQTLRNLGLPEKQGPVRVPVEVTLKRVIVMTVDDVESEEEAYAKADDHEYVKQHVETVYGQHDRLVGHQLAPRKDPEELVAGDFDTSYAQRRAQCENYNGKGIYCTRERGHTGRQHVGSSGESVMAVWPIEEGTSRRW